MNQHLGTLRHSILVEEDGRWLLPLTVGGPRGSPTGKEVGTRSLCEWYGRKYPGVQLYDPDSGSLEPVPELSPGRGGRTLRWNINSAGGSEWWFGADAGDGEREQWPQSRPTRATVPAPCCFQQVQEPWVEVKNFSCQRNLPGRCKEWKSGTTMGTAGAVTCWRSRMAAFWWSGW